MKRILSLVLAVLLLVASLPVTVFADADEEQIANILAQEHRRARGGRRSMKGYCGLMTSWQIYLRGINTELKVCDGKQQYDWYSRLDYTTGGYKVTPYSAREYSLEEALNAATHNGTRDVYNILVGFQSTNTQAGRIYGHCLMIYAILDGIVYFNESFSCSLQRTEGAMIAISIERFAEFYGRWTRFEGIVVFGAKEYTQECQEYPTHMFVETDRPTGLYTEPSFLQTEQVQSQYIRSVAAGERLLVTALYENTEGQYFYRVEDGGQAGYLYAGRAKPILFNYEDLTLTEAELPEALEPGAGFELEGEIGATNTGITSVNVSVEDSQGQSLMSHSLAKVSGYYDLDDDGFSNKMTFRKLEEGTYTFRVTAGTGNHYIENDRILLDETQITLYSGSFSVGQVTEWVNVEPAGADAQTLDGWVYQQGSWYYYEDGTPGSGWICWEGLDYYLQPDGSVTTGWASINGKDRLFTDTGAMRTGWVETQNGTMYLLSNGVAAVGWRSIDRERYFFDDDGLMVTDTWMEEDGAKYYLQSNGRTATGTLQIGDEAYSFARDGKLIAP